MTEVERKLREIESRVEKIEAKVFRAKIRRDVTAKDCRTCGVSKKLYCFYPDKAMRDGRMGVCKRCVAAELKARKPGKAA